MKTCTKCRQIKPLTEFHKDKKSLDGLNPTCKVCNKASARLWYLNNKGKAAKTRNLYYKKNKESSLARSRDWYLKNREHVLERTKLWAEGRKEIIKEYNATHKDKRKKEKKLWDKKNKAHCNEYAKNYTKEKFISDPNYKIRHHLRSRINKVISRDQRNGSAIKDLGCSLGELREHLEAKFKNGMTWDNHSTRGWHIDHILPLSSFDLTDREQFKQACHYTNLQPLWYEENIKKGARVLTQ